MIRTRLDPDTGLDKPKAKATYLILIEIKSTVELYVGKLGKQVLEAGYYLYVGSALNAIGSRISRHLQVDKKLHWHLDYLTKAGKIIGFFGL